jgi:hypothetical protein
MYWERLTSKGVEGVRCPSLPAVRKRTPTHLEYILPWCFSSNRTISSHASASTSPRHLCNSNHARWTDSLLITALILHVLCRRTMCGCSFLSFPSPSSSTTHQNIRIRACLLLSLIFQLGQLLWVASLLLFSSCSSDQFPSKKPDRCGRIAVVTLSHARGVIARGQANATGIVSVDTS